MKFSIATAATALTGLAAAVAVPAIGPAPAVQADYDVIVVGGGPAGLSAASALARVRRNALLIDSGEYRNQYTRRIHDVLGSDGVTPAYFRWKARQQIMQYPTVTMTNGTVTKIEPTGDADRTSFSVTANLADGETVVTARKVVLATGLRDIIPDTPGLEINWGKGIYWCPWCDGFEHADESFGVLGPFDQSGNTPLEVLTLNKDIIIFANGTDTPENRAIVETKLPGFETWHKIHNITVDNRTITSLERLQDGTDALDKDPSRATVPLHDLFRVNFDQGEPVERETFLVNWPNEQLSKVGEEAGVALYGGKLAANMSAGMITNVPGIYAVGDANSDNSTNVPHAMWSGKRAVVSIHVRLERENANFEIAEAKAGGVEKRGLEEREEQIWAQVNDGDFLDGRAYERL